MPGTRIERPERILWRPQEIEDFDEEFESIVWINRALTDAMAIQPSSKRIELFIARLKLALDGDCVPSVDELKELVNTRLKLSELVTSHKQLVSAYNNVLSQLHPKGYENNSVHGVDYEPFGHKLLRWIILPVVIIGISLFFRYLWNGISRSHFFGL